VHARKHLAARSVAYFCKILEAQQPPPPPPPPLPRQFTAASGVMGFA